MRMRFGGKDSYQCDKCHQAISGGGRITHVKGVEIEGRSTTAHFCIACLNKWPATQTATDYLMGKPPRSR